MIHTHVHVGAGIHGWIQVSRYDRVIRQTDCLAYYWIYSVVAWALNIWTSPMHIAMLS